MIFRIAILTCLGLSAVAAFSCGVKGPPLPPVPDTPQQTEASPRPTASRSP